MTDSGRSPHATALAGPIRDTYTAEAKVANVSHTQARLPFADAEPPPRAALVARWNILTRDILPGMAERSGWPILNDHCFMRVCLDTAIGAPWHLHVKRPAVRHLSNAQLAAALAVAEALALAPGTLDNLNRQSIQWRKATSA